MGEVFLAEDPRLDRRVALKRPSDEWLSAPDARERLHREARAAARLSHPNIAGIFDVLEHDDRPYIVMEFVPGEPLGSRLRQGRLPVQRAVEIGAQLADALGEAHARGVIHRDLKPANVMLMPSGGAKILDFGLAKAHPLTRDAGSTADPPTLVGAGSFAGTPGYSAPEQFAGGRTDQRSDLFSLGVLLYEMTAGRAAFTGADTMAIVLATINHVLPPLREAAPGAPPELEGLVARLLEKDPGRRPESASAVAATLRRIAHAMSERPTAAPDDAAAARRGGGAVRPANRRVLVVAIVSVAIVATLMWWQGARRSAPGRPVPARTPVVTVLPFRALTGDPDHAALAAGLEAMFANHMASSAGLLYVPARATAAGVSLDPGTRSAGVDFALDGSLHAAGSGLRLELRLVPAEGPRPVWERAVQGSPDDLLNAEPGLVAEIAAHLGGQGAQRAPVTTSLEAFRFFADGQRMLERRDLPPNVDQAVALFERAVALDPHFALAHAGLGQAYWRKYLATRDAGFAELAEDHASEALTRDPDLPLAHMAKAVFYNGTGRPDLALVELDHAGRSNPTDEVFRLRGQILFDLGRHDEGLEALDRAIAAGPDYFVNDLVKGTAEYRIGRLAEARLTLQRADEKQPGSPQTLATLGLVLWGLGELEEARATLERSIGFTPTATACSNLGTLLYQMGQYDLAIERYRQALALQPNNAQVARNLGDAYAKVGRNADARAAYERALALAEAAIAVNARDLVHLGLRAVCEAKLGRVDAARRHVREALALSDADNALLFRAAVVHALAGEPDAALTYLEQALAAGYPRDLARADDDLASLRDAKRFQDLVAAR